MFPRRNRQPLSSYGQRSVSDDWIRALPREKDQIFDGVVRRWESAFAMISVALDDALSMRARGKIICAQQHVGISAVLLSRLAVSLVSFCESLAHRGRYIRQIPRVEPLNADFFRGNTAQTAATWNGILHYVIFGDRQRFVHKLRILSSTVERLEREFDKAARDISGGPAATDRWAMLDGLHFDFNTCLREAEVVFKSFLRALPTEQLAALAGEIDSPAPKRPRMRLRLSRASA